MKLQKGQEVLITFKAWWFDDTGKIGKYVGTYQSRQCIYIEGSSNNNDNHKTPDGDEYTWAMDWNYFKVLGQVQLLFDFMYDED